MLHQALVLTIIQPDRYGFEELEDRYNRKIILGEALSGQKIV